jgi:hypothetical protein
MRGYLPLLLQGMGLYTGLALVQFLAPKRFLRAFTFGVDTDDAFTLLLARHWALLAALVGALLFYSASHPAVRAPAMAVAAVEKLAIAGLVFFGGWARTKAATRLAVVDAAMGAVLVVCLAGW